ncbi:Fic family protein [Eubacterium aggregans]|uniref:Fic family protein n=1 Tax=Eubacterium aggregans TaxID=81409 RepID=UPI003F38CD0E
MFEPKYNMTIEENIFIAKRNIVDYIWKSAKLEGINVTFPETKAIYEGINVGGLAVDDVVAINNLKHAWQFSFDYIKYPMDLPFICKLNQIIGANLVLRAGFIRNMPVSIAGTTWKPDMPIESIIKEEVAEIKSISNPTERAIRLMLYCMRKQIFMDGNKRTAMMAANHDLIANGQGIISIPIDKQLEFYEMLTEYYETSHIDYLMLFIYAYCIEGMDFSQQELSHKVQVMTGLNPYEEFWKQADLVGVSTKEEGFEDELER